MADFRVLTDTDVHNLLRNANQSEISHFISTLSETFKSYSLTDEATHQPHRTAVTRPPGQSTLFMPSTSPDNLGVKIVGIPPPVPKHQSTSNTPPTLKATMTVCDSTSKAIGILNASELTAFRTSLGAMLLFQSRTTVKHVVMFGAGKQAYWHIRLATILRGADISSITIINRSATRAADLLASLHASDLFTTHSHITLNTLTPDVADYDAKLEAAVRAANTIHCAVPSTQSLFPAAWTEDASGALRNDLYISAIGSYRLDMREIDPGLLRRIVRNEKGHTPPDRTGPVVVVVDSRAACFVEAGEVVDAGLTEAEVIEIGELVGLRGREEGDSKEKEGLERWLRDELVVYKSVGIGVMDLCIAKVLFELAREKGVGVCVEDF